MESVSCARKTKRRQKGAYPRLQGYGSLRPAGRVFAFTGAGYEQAGLHARSDPRRQKAAGSGQAEGGRADSARCAADRGAEYRRGEPDRLA